MIVYELTEGGKPKCAVSIATAPWFPFKPKARKGWLRYLLAAALRRRFVPAETVVTA